VRLTLTWYPPGAPYSPDDSQAVQRRRLGYQVDVKAVRRDALLAREVQVCAELVAGLVYA
jgi:hypothetical protein